jgi:NitT/TauT family transport system substrate-binding protein
MSKMKIAIPDLISNSYFPACAAVELGCFADEGLDIELELIFPVDRCYEMLRDGHIDFVGGSAHSALAAFPEWNGVKLLCAQGQGMYWFLVMRPDLVGEKGDWSVVKGRTIGAAPWVDMGLKQLLIDGGIDLEADNVTVAPVPGAKPVPGQVVNFGVTAAKALEEGKIDGFWANGMGTEVAVTSGAGKVVLDIRRGDGPTGCFNYTMASIATTDALIEREPETAAAAVRAVVRAQELLRADTSLAVKVASKLFPERETALIERLIERDLPYYDASISPEFVTGMNRFAREIGILDGDPAYEQVVATQFAPLWAPQENA